MKKKIIALTAALPLAAFALSACGVAADGTYTGTQDGVEYKLVLNNDDESAKFTAEEDSNTVTLDGSWDADDEQITWNDADTDYDSDVLDKASDIWKDSPVGSDPAGDFVGTTSTYERDGDKLTLNLDGEDVHLERADD